ncbi:aldose 1-epimerase [Lachnospiraceae bacterium XBB2008]|nr:aldose 1-epimerase [Lachnospiraceae bacterium XBB2008]
MATITRSSFGKLKDGTEASLYTLEAAGLKIGITDFGANIVSIFAPDASGNTADLLLGYDSVSGYEVSPSFFGATIGPNANRINNATFTIGDKKYDLAVNDGPNNLHSDFNLGFHKRLWKAEEKDGELKLSLAMKDGEMGFPGNMDVSVTFSITDDAGLKLHYHVTTDRPSLINMTNHAYFNLGGQDSGKILDHELKLSASRYTPVVDGAIPTGELADVAGTVFDFTDFRRVGDNIDDDVEQLKLVKGYDHNWVIDNGEDGTLKNIATLRDPKSGRYMDVLTDQPGVQFYAGNCITPEAGKGGFRYDVRCGLCLETQVYPDSINQTGFPNCVYDADKPYDTVTIYRFYAK